MKTETMKKIEVLYSDALKRRNEWNAARKKSTREGNKAQEHYELQKVRETEIELRTLADVFRTLGYIVETRNGNVEVSEL